MKKLILILMVGACFTQTYEDVVILKNGSEIHGIIIEEKPNVYIKIQSGDNLFVYQMDEIELIRKELKMNEGDFRNIYLTMGAGFITNKNLNIAHLTLDLAFTKNISLFVAGGFPTVIGGGLCIQQNRSGSGINFTAGTGFEILDGTLDLSSTMNYQFRIPNSNVFGIFGIAAGFYNIDNSAESYVWPVLSFEYRI